MSAGGFRYMSWTVRHDDGLYRFDGMSGRLEKIEECHYNGTRPLEVAVTEEQIAVVEEIKAELAAEPKKTRKPREKKAKPPAEVPADDAITTQIKAWEAAAQARLAELAAFKIEDQFGMDLIGELQREAFEQRKQIEAQRKQLKEPVLEQGRRIDNLFKPAIGYYGSIEEACQRMQSEARAAMRAAEDAALKAIAESGGEADPQSLVIAHGGARLELPETSREVIRWEWTQTDPTKIPEQYWLRVLNTKLIDEMVKTHQGDTDIPGIAVTRVVEVANKAVRK